MGKGNRSTHTHVARTHIRARLYIHARLLLLLFTNTFIIIMAGRNGSSPI